MHLLHKNQENFSHKKFRPTDPISKMTPFWPTFGFPNSTQTTFEIFDFQNFDFSKMSKNRPKNFFSKKWVFLGSVCENGKVDLGIAPRIFFSSNRPKKLEKNIARSPWKISHIRPKKTQKSIFVKKLPDQKKKSRKSAQNFCETTKKHQ